MARCPYCNHVLEDRWIKREGASLMGKASGEAKARTRDQASAASRVRWDQQRAHRKATSYPKRANEPQSLEEELAQEAKRRTFVQPLAKKKDSNALPETHRRRRKRV